jgi:hypothetical protein
MSDELKPCPFCGSTNLMKQSTLETIQRKYYRWIHCENCGASGKSWNNRPIEDVLQKRIDELIQSVGIMATFKPTMEININKPVDMALEVSNYIVGLNQRISALEAECDALKAENAKLKEKKPRTKKVWRPTGVTTTYIMTWEEYEVFLKSLDSTVQPPEANHE